MQLIYLRGVLLKPFAILAYGALIKVKDNGWRFKLRVSTKPYFQTSKNKGIIPITGS
jgi:hypothetical protein